MKIRVYVGNGSRQQSDVVCNWLAGAFTDENEKNLRRLL